MITPSISIIGIGHMGSSLIRGLLKDGHSPSHLWAADPSKAKLAPLENAFALNTTTDNTLAVQTADIAIIAVKPPSVSTVALQIKDAVRRRNTLILSVAAGIREESLQHWLGGKAAIVRAMPNTPALINCGATALYANQFVTANQLRLAESVMRSVGIVVWLEDERLLDAVTALSGSGPAYFFLVMEAMQAAGEELGLSKNIARLLTLETALGAARMAIEGDAPLETLRQHVTSPGGTTEKAISVLEEHHIRAIFRDALAAAKHRSEELAILLGEKK